MSFLPRRRLFVLLLLLCCLSPGAAPALLVLMDRSAGMGLPAQGSEGPTRLEAACTVVAGLPAVLETGTRFGLITFAEDPRPVLEFGTGAGELASVLAGLVPEGVSRLEPALETATACLASAPGPGRRILLLVSDCLNTGAPAAALPELDACRKGMVELWVLGFDLPHNRPRAGRIRSWVLGNGGLFFDIAEAEELAARLDSPPGISAAPGRGGDVRPPKHRTWPAWLLAAAFAGGLAVLGGGYRRYLDLLRRRLAREKPGSPLRLELIPADGGRSVLEAGNLPLLLTGAAGQVRADAAGAPASPGRREGLLIAEERGTLRCTSLGGPALLDGVARTSLRLREGSCLRLGSVLIRVAALPVPARHAPPPPRPVFLFWLAPLALLLLAAFFLPGRTPLPDSAAQPSGPAPAAGRDVPARRPEPPRQTAPGEAPACFPADILCFHAHPDDESLDFGVLLARAEAEGLRTAVVLFTDGEGGNDAYPARAVGGPYPPRKLAGSGLADVRVDECVRALTRLGVGQYVRLGLKNHPYNRADQVMSVASTVAAWGGEEELVRRLQELLAGFYPRLVVSPAGPSPGVEHFEHRAVGYLVGRAVRAWTDGGEVAAHLTALKPGEEDEDPRRLVFPAEPVAGGRGGRDRQLLALSEYRSQYDAVVAGAARLPNYDSELYRLESGGGPGSVADTLLAALKGGGRVRH